MRGLFCVRPVLHTKPDKAPERASRSFLFLDDRPVNRRTRWRTARHTSYDQHNKRHKERVVA